MWICAPSNVIAKGVSSVSRCYSPSFSDMRLAEPYTTIKGDTNATLLPRSVSYYGGKKQKHGSWWYSLHEDRPNEMFCPSSVNFVLVHQPLLRGVSIASQCEPEVSSDEIEEIREDTDASLGQRALGPNAGMKNKGLL